MADDDDALGLEALRFVEANECVICTGRRAASAIDVYLRDARLVGSGRTLRAARGAAK